LAGGEEAGEEALVEGLAGAEALVEGLAGAEALVEALALAEAGDSAGAPIPMRQPTLIWDTVTHTMVPECPTRPMGHIHIIRICDVLTGKEVM
jgi:hypothetical protein